MDGDQLALQYVTIAQNEAPFAANVYRSVTNVTSFGSVIALGEGSGVDCGPGTASTTSLGYNFDGDGSCLFGAGPGDVSSGGDPLLGQLDDNGGPTRTLLPVAGSPLQDAIPLSVPQAFGTDQRGVSRPQGTGADIGAVEIAPPMLVPDTATTRVDSSIAIQVLQNDVERRDFDPRTLRVARYPLHGTAEVRGNHVRYTPSPGFSGLDAFVYEVCYRQKKTSTPGCPGGLVRVFVGGP